MVYHCLRLNCNTLQSLNKQNTCNWVPCSCPRILPRKTSGCCGTILLHFFPAVSPRGCILFCTAPLSQSQLPAQISFFISSVFCSAAKNLMGFCLSILGLRRFDLGLLWLLRGKYVILNYVANLTVVRLKYQ